MTKKYNYPSIAYPGGKSRVAKKIIKEMPPHKIYIEPFAGAAHVFFKKEKADKNILNDKNKELIKFFRDIKNKKVCCDISANKKKFLKLRKKKNKSVCEHVYVNRNSYGGRDTFGGTSSYGYHEKKNRKGKKSCIDGTKLKNTKLTTKDYRKIIREMDSKEALFYVDPPYVKANEKECLYGKGNCEVTPEDVAKSLRKIKGKAIISYDDHPDVRRAFRGFKIEKLDVPYTLRQNENGKSQGVKRELLIKNYTCKLTKDRKICKKV